MEHEIQIGILRMVGYLVLGVAGVTAVILATASVAVWALLPREPEWQATRRTPARLQSDRL